ncbi:MAG: phosphatidylcholine/phosphatidylserine synthase [Kiritimatiellae bacterium]|nr:phosphatidylcholine/phosphatidylserine synthase [Kiritimatiellia bacterium]
MRRFRFKKRKHKNSTERVHIKSLLPNLITSLAVCGGISAIVISAINFAKSLAGWTVTDSDWKMAIFALMFSCVCDAMDGRVARLLNASSKLGAELDSLADFVNFGVAPSILLYFWVLTPSSEIEGINKFLFAAVLFYSLCTAFRLARFNIMLEEPTAPYWKPFFLGVPAPGGCWMALTPIPLSWMFAEICPEVSDFLRHPYFIAGILIVVGSLMASRIPTISLKTIHISKKQVLPVTAGLLLFIACLVGNLWTTFGVIGALYLLSVPIVVWIFTKIRAKHISSNPSLKNESL